MLPRLILRRCYKISLFSALVFLLFSQVNENVEAANLGESCPDIEDCTGDNQECSDQSVCVCSVGLRPTEDGSACRWPSYEETCVDRCINNLVCFLSDGDTKKCGCGSDDFYFDEDTDRCQNKRAHGEACDSTNECADENVLCRSYVDTQTRCLCDARWMYYSTILSKCDTLQSILVDSPTVSSRTLYSITFIWNVFTKIPGVRYRIRSGNRQEATRTGGTFYGLIPGTNYEFNVDSYIPRGDLYYELVKPYYVFNHFTAPARPGLIDVLQSDLSSVPATVVFGPSIGRVHHYNFSLYYADTSQRWGGGIGANGRFSVSTSLNRVYDYVIFSVVNGIQSKHTTGSFITSSSVHTYGGPCTGLHHCRSTMMCVDFMCTCDSSTQFWDGDQCQLLGIFSEACSSNDQCEETLSCVGGVCSCQQETQYQDDTRCEQRKDFGDDCSSIPNECKPSLTCSSSGTCSCDDDAYLDGTTCQTRKDIGDSCSNLPNECKPTLTCSSGGACSCGDDTYLDGSSCRTRKGVGDDCSNLPGECKPTLICSSGGTCSCDDDAYLEGSTCQPRKDYGVSCSPLPNECKPTLICSSGGACSCDDDDTYWDDFICQPRKGHAAACSTREECVNDPDADCIDRNGQKMCLCKPGSIYFESREYPCDSVNLMGLLRSPTISSRLTDTIELTWTPSTSESDLPGVQYRLDISPTDGSQAAWSTGGNLTDLTPGTKYGISVESYLPADDYYDRQSVRVEITPDVWTLPSNPGQLDWSASQLKTSPMTFVFIAAVGAVDEYKVSVLLNDTVVVSKVVSYNRVVDLMLESSVTYQYRIVSVNGNGDESPPTSGVFKTGDTGKQHGEFCTESDECFVGSDLECVERNGQQKCLCAPRHYYYQSQSTCIQVYDLHVQNPFVSLRLADTIELTWSPSVQDPDVQYKLVITPQDGSHTTTSSGGRATDLTPGTAYRISVQSYVPASVNYDSQSTNVHFTQNIWTIPSKPGQLDWSASQLKTSPMTFAFTAAIGTVDEYKFSVLLNDTVVASKTITSNKITDLELDPDVTYSYHIVSVNGNGDQSHTTSGTFRTGKTGPADGEELEEEEEEESDGLMSLVIIAAPAAGGALIIVVIAIVCIRRCRQRKSPQADRELTDVRTNKNNSNRRKDSEDDSMSSNRRPMKIRDFKEAVIIMHKYDNVLFNEEFKELQSVSSRFSYPSDRKVQDKTGRNKQGQIPVRVTSPCTSRDIDATFIPGVTTSRDYIACKGPTQSSIAHFWNMVWEQRCQVIVMLSDSTENDKTKAEQRYLPQSIDSVTYGHFTIDVLKMSKANKAVVREIRLSVDKKHCNLTHFLLPAWWGRGCQMSLGTILDFVKDVRQNLTIGNPRPLVVQCSADAGRTGTLIALDYFMQFIERHSLEDSMDVFHYVLQMRKNRRHMVPDLADYILLFDMVTRLVQRKMEGGPIYDSLYEYADSPEDALGRRYQKILIDEGDGYEDPTRHGHPGSPTSPLYEEPSRHGDPGFPTSPLYEEPSRHDHPGSPAPRLYGERRRTSHPPSTTPRLYDEPDRLNHRATSATPVYEELTRPSPPSTNPPVHATRLSHQSLIESGDDSGSSSSHLHAHNNNPPQRKTTNYRNFGFVSYENTD